MQPVLQKRASSTPDETHKKLKNAKKNANNAKNVTQKNASQMQARRVPDVGTDPPSPRFQWAPHGGCWLSQTDRKCSGGPVSTRVLSGDTGCLGLGVTWKEDF